MTRPVTGPGRYVPHLGCAASAERRGDDMVATAPPADRWLLIEYRDAWPRVAADVLGPLADEVLALCARRRCRPVLIRRHGRQDRSTPRRWGLADARPGHEQVRWGQLSADEHLLDVLTSDDPGVVSREPVYLVCAHGRHDACCAVRGRPVAAALAAAYPDRTWECSHVGGDRFAPNLVLLPHGLMYGHVTATSALDVVTAYDEGRVVPGLLRGRTSLGPAVQAAQHFARAGGSSYELDALRLNGVRQVAPDTWTVRMAGAEVTVRARQVEIDGAMTCASRPPGRVRIFEHVRGQGS